MHKCNPGSAPGANLPITAEQLKAVLGNTQVQDFARQLGLPVDRRSRSWRNICRTSSTRRRRTE